MKGFLSFSNTRRPEEQQDGDGHGQHGQGDAVADGVNQLDGGEVGLQSRLKARDGRRVSRSPSHHY